MYAHFCCTLIQKFNQINLPCSFPALFKVTLVLQAYLGEIDAVMHAQGLEIFQWMHKHNTSKFWSAVIVDLKSAWFLEHTGTVHLIMKHSTKNWKYLQLGKDSIDCAGNIASVTYKYIIYTYFQCACIKKIMHCHELQCVCGICSNYR